jgi:hypothetical protein
MLEFTDALSDPYELWAKAAVQDLAASNATSPRARQPPRVVRYVLRSSAKPNHASGSATAHRMAIAKKGAPPNLA